MSGGPRASIIVPSFDHGRYVEAAVASALAQTERNLEVIVIDDGSQDDSPRRLSRLSDPRLRVFFQENRGLSRTLNRGLAAARAPWVKFLPSDDLLERDCLARQLAVITEDPGLCAVFALPTVVDGEDRPLADPAPQAWFDTDLRAGVELLVGLLERNFLCAPGALFSRELAIASGGFDPSVAVAQDYDLWLRLLARGRGRLLPERLVRVRWHGGNQSARATVATEAERAYALVRALSRHSPECWVDWYRSAHGGAGGALQARLELAAVLVRTGLRETWPFARGLLVEARALGAPPPSDPALAPLLEVAPELVRPGAWGDIAEFKDSEPPLARERGFISAALRSPAGHRGSGLRRLARAARRAISRARERRRGSAPHARVDAPKIARGPRSMHWLVLAVVPLDDSGGGQRSAQLARALARRGDRVTYAARFPRTESVALQVAELTPAPESVPWDLTALRRLLRESDERIRVLAELPEAQVVGLAREASQIGARVLYDKVDAWEHSSFATWYSRADEEAMIAISDDLIGTARPLVRALAASGRPVHYLPNAVDPGVFHRRPGDEAVPPDLPRGERTLVYAGALWGEWLDWDLLIGVAEARPRWNLLLIGDRPPAIRPLPVNVHLLGLKPQRALPPYLAVADACLIPFLRTPLTDAVSPLKLFEYLAMRRPVIAPPLGELAGAPYVFFAEDVCEVLDAVERAVATPPPEAEIGAFVARHTWDARAASLAVLAGPPTITVLVLRRGGERLVRACVDALLTARGERSYRIAVIDDGGDASDDAELLAREEAGEIVLLRSALRGTGASRNLGIRATRGELVVFLDATQHARGPGWLDEAVDLLASDRRIGAVGAGGRVNGGGVAWLDVAGLVVPRAVLTRVGAFDESFDPEGCAGIDLSFRLREAGYELALLRDPGLEPNARSEAPRGAGPTPQTLRDLRLRWRHRPDLLASLADSGPG